MIQEIITYAIIGIAIGVAGYRFYTVVLSLKKTVKVGQSVGKCSGCSTDCAMHGSSKSKSCSPQKAI